MSPVRWKFVLIGLCLTINAWPINSISISESLSPIADDDDGWKPIVGTSNNYREEIIAQYKNSLKIDTDGTNSSSSPTSPVKEVKQQPQTQQPPRLLSKQTPKITWKTQLKSVKIPMQHSKLPVHHVAAGNGQNYRNHHYKNKPQPPPQQQNKRIIKAPIRIGGPYNSNRDDLKASASSGSFAYYKQAPINTRLVPQANNHFDYNFVPQQTGSDVYQQYLRPNVGQQFIYQTKQPANDLYYTFQTQNDEYTRNLVPPPPSYAKYDEKEKPKTKDNFKKEQSPLSNENRVQNQQFVNSKPLKEPNIVQESVVIALNPPPLNQQQKQQNFYSANTFPAKQQPVDVQVTKEQLNHFQNNVPQNYNPQLINFEDFFTVPKPTAVELNLPTTYDVTEDKYLQEPQPPVFQDYSTHLPKYNSNRQEQSTVRYQSEADFIKPFLPTPIIPGTAAPTSPTQTAVSDLYALMKNKEDPFSIKEVSTHYPIVGTPAYHEYETTTVTTNAPIEEETTTFVPSTTERHYSHNQRRPGHRRRRPNNKQRFTTTQEPITTTTTTTEEPVQEIEQPYQQYPTGDVVRQRPQQRRKPSRYRTTESPANDNDEYRPTRTRQRLRTRPPTHYENPVNNHRVPEEETRYYVNRRRPVKPIYESVDENQQQAETVEEVRPQRKRKRPITYLQQQQQQQLLQEEEKPIENQEIVSEIYQISTEETTPTEKPAPTDRIPATYYQNPENEIDFSTFKSVNPSINQEVAIKADENTEASEGKGTNEDASDDKQTDEDTRTNDDKAINEVTLAATTPPETTTPVTSATTTTATTTATTTTTEAPATTTQRRRRPINYNVSRPRFSVKDYRQRLSQYTSTSSTTETVQTQRNRLPTRIRKPLRTTTARTTTEAPELEEADGEEEDDESPRQRFKPKDPRYRSQYNNQDSSLGEKRINKLNSRIRPFGKQRATTESSTTTTTTTAKVHIKPNLFHNRRRPTAVSLKAKIASKYNQQKESEEETTPYDDSLELKKVEEATTGLENAIDRMDPTTVTTETLEISSTERYNEDDSTDSNRNESIMYSQRVSDLTSSAQREAPGFFKNVPPASRRIPSYFTIATEDPVLPIEAFFENLRDKDKEK